MVFFDSHEHCVMVKQALKWHDIPCVLLFTSPANVALCQRAYGACRMFRGVKTCYWDTCETNKHHSDASKLCPDAGGELATIDSQNEADFIKNAIKLSSKTWLGMQTVDVTNWSDWASGHPQDEPCIVINTDYKWEAVGCGSWWSTKYSSLCNSKQDISKCFSDEGKKTCFWQSYDRSYNRSSARHVCGREGGKLVKLYEKEIIDFISNNLTLSGRFWTGMRKLSNETWDSIQFPSSNWLSGEPSNGLVTDSSGQTYHENCLLLTSGGKWMSDRCRHLMAIPSLCVFSEGTYGATAQTTMSLIPTTWKTTESSTVKLTTEKATTDSPSTVDLTTMKSTTDSPSTVDLTTEKMATESPSTVEVTTEKMTTDSPSIAYSTTEKTMTDFPTTVDLTTEKSTTNSPSTVDLTTKFNQAMIGSSSEPSTAVDENSTGSVPNTHTKITTDTTETTSQLKQCYNSTNCTVNQGNFNTFYNTDAQKWLQNHFSSRNTSLINNTNGSDDANVRNMPKFLKGPLFLHVVDNSKPPKTWSKAPVEAPLAPAIGSVVIIFLAAEIALVLLMDANHLRKHAKLWWRNVRRLKRKILR